MTNKYEDKDILIRPAKKGDMISVDEMIQELADFEKMPDGPKLKAADLQRDGFETQPPEFHCLIAELASTNRNIGYALYFHTYSTWEGRSMKLEDLYVRPDERRRGVGHRLFDAVAKEACSMSCSRLEFHVLKWNDARSFYEKKGAVNLTELEEWCNYRLAGDALQKLGGQIK